MLHRKLLEVLQLLDAQAHARLRLFLQSPYFNHRSHASELVRLYEHIMASRAEADSPTLSKAFVSGLFFPDRPFTEGQKAPIDALASDLFLLVKRFIGQMAFEGKDLDFNEGMALAKYYRRFGMEERFWQIIQAIRKSQMEEKTRDANFFQKQVLLESEAGAFVTLNNRFEDDANVETIIQNLDTAYSISKLELLCGLIYQQHLTQGLSVDLSSPLIQSVLQSPEHYPSAPLYYIYRLVFQLLQKNDDDEAFADFERLLAQHSDEIPFDKLRNLKAYYRFFWNRRYVNSGGAQIRQQMFEVYKEHYQGGYFYEGEAIMINALKSLVLLGLKAGQFEWIKSVLDKHPPTHICGTNHPFEAHSLCLAEYYLHTKDYRKALDTLVYKHFENPNYSLWAEMLLIKAYFETDDDLLDARMKALEQKVRRTKIAAETKQRYYRFLQKLDKIIKYGREKNSPKRARIVEEIKTTPGIIEREWLLEKLGAL